VDEDHPADGHQEVHKGVGQVDHQYQVAVGGAQFHVPYGLRVVMAERARNVVFRNDHEQEHIERNRSHNNELQNQGAHTIALGEQSPGAESNEHTPENNTVDHRLPSAEIPSLLCLVLGVVPGPMDSQTHKDHDGQANHGDAHALQQLHLVGAHEALLLPRVREPQRQAVHAALGVEAGPPPAAARQRRALMAGGRGLSGRLARAWRALHEPT